MMISPPEALFSRKACAASFGAGVTLGPGWAYDPALSWSTAQVAEIRLARDVFGTCRTLELGLHAFGASLEAPMTVRLTGALSGAGAESGVETQITTEALTSLDCPCPAFAEGEDETVLFVACTPLRSPFSLNRSTDDRKLGVALTLLRPCPGKDSGKDAEAAAPASESALEAPPQEGKEQTGRETDMSAGRKSLWRWGKGR